MAVFRPRVDILNEMDGNDRDLLVLYTTRKDEDAFARLVKRHLPLVYSSAFRQVRSHELAEEVSQAVFFELAQRSSTLSSNTILSAWLYEVARRKAIDVVRRESRRQNRESAASQILPMHTEPNPWAEIEPNLDDAMQTLEQPDRAAVMLRFFENKSLREVGEALGASENAVQKRITRALERLQEFLAARKISVTVVGLAALISQNAVQAAPLGLAAVISAATISSTSTTLITMTALQKTLVATTVVVALGTGIYQQQRVSDLSSQLIALRAEPKPGELKESPISENTTALIAALRAENARLKENSGELLRLRGEVARLRTSSSNKTFAASNSDSSTEETIRNWLTRVNLLKNRLQEIPSANVPDLQLLSEEDWLSAVKGMDLQSEKDYRKALSTLRNYAQNKVAKILQQPLSKYVKDNNGNFPASLSDLQAYLDKPVSEDIFSRYAIVPAKDISGVSVGGKYAISTTQAVDAEYDQRIVIGTDGWGSVTYKPSTPSHIDIITPAVKAYAAANNGNEPVDPEQLRPYLSTPEQVQAFEELVKQKNASVRAR